MDYYIFYERIMKPGSGFKFECDFDGHINESKLTEAERERLSYCRANQFGDFRNPKVIAEEHTNHSVFHGLF